MAVTPYGVPKINFQKLFAGDQQLQAQLAQIQANNNSYGSDLNAGRNTAIAQYGGVPNNLPANVNIDPVTQQLAQQNTQAGTSTLAQLQNQYQRSQSASIGDLGARGIIRSGAYGQHAIQNFQNYNVAQAQAQQNLLQQLSSLWSGYQQNTQQSVGQQSTAYSDALQRIVAMINGGLLTQPTQATATTPHAAPSFQIVPGRGRALL